VVAAWGDPYKAAWDKSLIPAFEKKYGVTVTWVPGFSTATLAKLQAEKDSPQIDIAMMDDGPSAQAAAIGLVERTDRSKLSNARDIEQVAFAPGGGYGVGFGLDAIILYYNTKTFADNKWTPPTSWLDLYRPEFKGKISVHSVGSEPGLFLLLFLNRIAGGTETNMDPGFKKMKELAPNVLTFDNFGQTPTLIQQGATAIGTWGVTRVGNLAATGVPVQFVYPKEGAGGYQEVISIVKGRPADSVDLAYKFMDMMLSKDEQENNAKWLGLGPVNRRATLTADVTKRVVTTDMIKRLWFPDLHWIDANRAAWIERWNKEIESH
jgi:putative spermidine/putrescine transport system substrate-binding protein